MEKKGLAERNSGRLRPKGVEKKDSGRRPQMTWDKALEEEQEKHKQTCKVL